MASSGLISDTVPWKDLKGHVQDINKTHLRDLMNDVNRCQAMMVEFDGMLLYYSRQRATLDTMGKLIKLAEAAGLKDKINRRQCLPNLQMTHLVGKRKIRLAKRNREIGVG